MCIDRWPKQNFELTSSLNQVPNYQGTVYPGSRGPNAERGRQQKENPEAKRRASAIENLTSILVITTELVSKIMADKCSIC